MMLVMAMLCVAGIANADCVPACSGMYSMCGEQDQCITPTVIIEPRVITPDPHPWRLGFSLDVGVPSGIALGLVLHPNTDYLSLGVAFTENVLSPGVRGSIQFDPFAALPRLPIGLFLDLQGGYAADGVVPGHSNNLPAIGYDYLNMYGGVRLGKLSGFHWVFEAGPSYIHATTNNFQVVLNGSSVDQNLKLGNPTINAWVLPTFITGFAITWDVR